MAQKLYKWTGDIIQPEAYDSAYEAPQWYGYDSDDNGYAFLNTDYAALCSSSNADLAATTATADKNWVKSSSRDAYIIDAECRKEIREAYSLEDELKALRTDDTTVKTAIAAIVTTHSAKKDALVGD